MAEALPARPRTAVEATETHVRILGRETIHVDHKPRDHPCSVRLHGNLILRHGSRRAVGELDHRVEVTQVSSFTCVEACSELIHGMLAEAPATKEYDLAAENWVDSTRTPLDIAKGIARYIADEFDDEMGVAVPSLHFDIHLPELRVTFGELCTICLLELDSETEDEDTVALLPCHHVFHRTCIATWLHQAPTCPTCRREVIGAEDELSDGESEDELWFLDDVAREDENYCTMCT